jgi:hypothetical protein
MSETVAFVLCIENNAIRDQALLLIDSIRTFAGAYKDSEIIAISPRGHGIDTATRAKLDEFGVRYVDLHLNRTCPEYAPANRVYGGAWAARNSSASTLIVLDSDTVFFGEPEPLGPEWNFAGRPVDLGWASSTGPGTPFEEYLEALCELGETRIDVLPYLKTTIDQARVRAIYNTGYTFVRRQLGILELAADIFTKAVMRGLRPRKGTGKRVLASTGLASAAASEYWSSSQAVLAVAAWTMGPKIKKLDRRYNVPLHLLATQRDLARWTGVDPLHVHYHWMLNVEHRPRALELLSVLGIAPDKLDWLAERSPLP